MKTTIIVSKKCDEATGLAQVIFRLGIARKNRPQIKSGIYIKPEWYKNNEISIPKSGKFNKIEIMQAKKAKADLETLIARYTIICNLLGHDADEIDRETLESAEKLTENIQINELSKQTIEDVISKLKNKDKVNTDIEKPKTFDDYADIYLNREGVTYNNQKKSRCVFKVLKTYEQFIRLTDKKHKDFTLDINTISTDIISDFFDFYKDEADLLKEYPKVFEKIGITKIHKRGRNSLIERKKELKAFFNYLIKNRYTKNQPFDGFEIGTERYGTPYFLTLEERNKIADFDIKSKWLAMTKEERKPLKSALSTMLTQRDIFIFQCLIGCRVSDLMTLKPDSIDKDHMLNYIPVKTKSVRQTVTSVPLNTQALKLIEKYKNVDKKGRLFPFISSQKYNDAIKDVCHICGIDRLIDKLNPVTQQEEKIPLWRLASSHMARRTFAGNAYDKVQDPEIICSMTGHVEGSKAFNRYRTINNDLKKKVIDLIS
jgi:integrase